MRVFRFLPCAALASVLAFASAAHAGDFLIDPTGGTSLSFSDPDDGFAVTNLGFSFTQFGLTRTGINVTTNGFIQLRAFQQGANVSPADAPFPTSGGIRRIAGAWDDYILRDPTPGNPQGDSVIETKGTNYYAATYHVHKSTPGGGLFEFQIALFGGDVTIADGTPGGHLFKANDVAFSYKKMQTPDGAATIGMDAGNGTDFIVPPASQGGDTHGVFTNYNSLTYFSSNGGNGLGAQNGYLLFSSNGDGSAFTPSVVLTGNGTAAAPEPATLGLMGVGCWVLGLTRKRVKNGLVRRQRG